MGDPWHGISGGRSLHAWLLDSSYVRSQDDARFGSKRKKGKVGSAARNGEGGSNAKLEGRQVGGFSEAELKGQATPGKRKLRRMANDRLLRELAGPLDAQDIGALYTPPPWGGKTDVTELERITSVDIGGHGNSAAAAWEPFRTNVDMDRQEQFLHGRQVARKEKPALVAWRAVDKRARNALRRSADWPLLRFYEEELLSFCRLEMQPDSVHQEFVLPVDAPYHRLLLHGLCQFHGLSSYTACEEGIQEGGEAAEPGTLMVIRKGTDRRGALTCSANGMGPIRLVDFLDTFARDVPSSEC